MEKAKAAVSGFMHKSGHHDTTVDETRAPAITHENVTKTQHENVSKAVDREVHQDHYHTTVQPVQDKQVLPEQHHHNTANVEHKTFHHGDSAAVKAGHEQEIGQFQDKRTENQTQHTQSANPTVAGEHRHHHVHEVVQPVIQKETIQPSVVHTTIPVHETHHLDPTHHNASTLPAMSMDEFKNQGHSSARTTTHDEFKGEPKKTMGSTTGHGGLLGHSSGGKDSHTGTHDSHTGTQDSHNTGSKPSMMQKLNPKVDADGDGKRGFMD